MRLSEFWLNVEHEWGSAYGRSLVRSHVLQTLGNRTAEEALTAGEAPRRVWLALCADLDVPDDRRLGVEVRGPAGAD